MATVRSFRVLIAGGGVAALEAALALRALAGGVAEIELLAPEDEFVYRALSVAAGVGAGQPARFPLGVLADEAGAMLATGALAGLDPERHVARTTDGDEIEYDGCLLALGAVPRAAVKGAITFAGPRDEAALNAVMNEAATGRVRRLLVAVPSSIVWPLPAYELALLASARLSDAGAAVEIALVTPEDSPLGLFGRQASDAIAELLALRGIAVETCCVPLFFDGHALHVAPDGPIAADCVIALPNLVGPRVSGVPANGDGFVPVDANCGVIGLDDVWAAGDMTTYPLKQGGIAAQQADAAAESIAARAGVDLTPAPFRPVLRGLLLTGLVPRYLRAGLPDHASQVDTAPLWWPPAKIVGRYLSPALALHAGEVARPPSGPAVEVEVELDERGAWSAL